MADNTLQFRWIVTIKENLEALFADKPDTFVAGDLLWYAVEGQPKACTSPDTMVVFGRPKGDRSSYKQWLEDNIAPQVVFEILSPGNTPAEMTRKFAFYHDHGVEEYYLYDPDQNELLGWRRDGNRLIEIDVMDGWVSPRLGIRFVFEGQQLRIYRPDDKPFLTFVELQQRAEQEAARAEQEAARAEQEAARAERLATKLRELGIDPEQL